MDGLHQLVAACLYNNECFEFSVPQGERETGEEMEMRAQHKTDQGEYRVHRPRVQSAEINGLIQKAERNQQLADVQHDCIARVGIGHSPTNPLSGGRAELPTAPIRKKNAPSGSSLIVI